ncbi:hypothetical protein CRG98_048512 [Punica granatum]|uniref:Uncharacterized protein n=1 Tax=Punica granatum TaxID=22663 RepID=A0A2I0HHA7_PUNGR|nr:hypothetical protein CRG98_048512 [Punica granatum]
MPWWYFPSLFSAQILGRVPPDHATIAQAYFRPGPFTGNLCDYEQRGEASRSAVSPGCLEPHNEGFSNRARRLLADRKGHDPNLTFQGVSSLFIFVQGRTHLNVTVALAKAASGLGLDKTQDSHLREVMTIQQGTRLLNCCESKATSSNPR